MFIRLAPSLQGLPSETTASQVYTGGGGGGGGFEGLAGGGGETFEGFGGVGEVVGALAIVHFEPLTETESGNQPSLVLWMFAPTLTVLFDFGCNATVACSHQMHSAAFQISSPSLKFLD